MVARLALFAAVAFGVFSLGAFGLGLIALLSWLLIGQDYGWGCHTTHSWEVTNDDERARWFLDYGQQRENPDGIG